MTDRAKKISELTVTTSVANTDKLVVLKDAANASIATTRAISISSIAQSLTPLVQAAIPNTTVISNTVTLASNGSTPVTWFTYAIGAGSSGCCHVEFHARDTHNAAVTGGFLSIVALGNEANMHYGATSLGNNYIGFDSNPVVNNVSNTVSLQFYRNAATTTNVTVKYTVTII